jgi:hypothetical protein
MDRRQIRTDRLSAVARLAAEPDTQQQETVRDATPLSR